MKKKKIGMNTLGILITALFLLGSCTSPTNPSSGGKKPTTPKGTIIVRIDDTANLSQYPSLNGAIKSYKLTLTAVGSDPVTQTVPHPFPENGFSLTQLKHGTYHLLVEGWNATGASGDLIANNGAGVDLALSASQLQTSVLLDYFTEGLGQVEITYQWPEGNDIGRVDVNWQNEGFQSLTVNTSGGTSTAVFSLAETAAGEKTLVTRLYDGNDDLIGTDLESTVWVFDQATTRMTWNLDPNDFNEVPAAPSSVSVEPALGGARVQWTDNSLFETGYKLERSPAGAASWTTVSAAIPTNTTHYIDNTFEATATTLFDYRVSAFNGTGSSAVITTASSVNTTGYIHPTAGTFSPLDVNGAAAGLGWSTATWKRGGHFSGSDLEIGVYSKNAHRVLLEIYSVEHYWVGASKYAGRPANGGHALYEYWMEKGSDDVWRAKILDVKQFASSGLIYAFRAWGPNWTWPASNPQWTRGNSSHGFSSDVDTSQGHRFNPNKVLTDPYAYELTHDTEYPELVAGGENGGIYGTGGSTSLSWGGGSSSSTYSGTVSTSSAVLDRRNVDTGRFVSKTYAVDVAAYGGARPNIPQKDLIVYEAHVKGLSKHPSSGHMTTILTNVKNLAGFEAFADAVDVPSQYRGTYKGAGMMAKYFKALGINAIEFVPVHETRNDLNDSYTGGANNPGNYWGYMTYSFFAPDRHYSYNKSPGGPTSEFQEMVAAFAAEGIEVWLDVVYNHTGEGGTWGSPDITGFTSYGGFDAAEYYHLNPFDKRGIVDGATGVGNQVNFSRSNNKTLVLDSLTYWIDQLGVGGFRFDLAAVLGRDIDSVSSSPSDTYWDRVKPFNGSYPFLADIASLGSNKGAKMIAEAWDIWSYPVGQFPNGWGEWNGRFRDATRKFLKGEPGGHDGVSVNDAFHGDYNNFNNNGGPHKSVNFLVAHDGFTLADMVSYNTKTNTARDWPFGPSDGGNDNNDSWDSTGTAKPASLSVQEFRRQRLRNFWVWQFFSRGVPMIVWGDEFARTQNGNNNPYNIDSVATWNNYEQIGRDSPQSAPPQGTWDPVSTALWSETVYHDNVATDSKVDSMNSLFLFSRSIIQLRNNEPALRQGDYTLGISYTKINGDPIESWDRARRLHLAGSAVDGGSDYVLMVNMWEEDLDFTLPTAPDGKVWKRIVDTAHWAEAAGDSPVGNYWTDAAAPTISAPYNVKAWSIVVLKGL